MSARDPFCSGWLLQELARLLPEVSSARLCVAFSGGVDSTALLAALAPRRAAFAALRAVHVDHALQPASQQWSLHCRAVADTLKVPLTVLKLEVPRTRGHSLEAAARTARYACLAACMTPGEVLLTAHHQDDQLETVLLQLLRGAGVAGLAAMPAVTPFPPGLLARPLLPRSREDLVQFAAVAGLPWVEDGSNTSLAFERNYLRHQVLPAIRARWPGAAGAVARSARHAAQAQQLLEELGRSDVARAAWGASLSVAGLARLPEARRRNALRHWITRQGHLVPDERRLIELSERVIHARPDAHPEVSWGDSVVRREAGRLTLGRRPTQAAPESLLAEQVWDWRQSSTCVLPAGGSLTLTLDARGPVNLAALPAELRVRARSGGERLTPVRGGPRRAVKSLLQEAHVPLAGRKALPLIYAGGTLVAVADLWLDESVQAQEAAPLRGRIKWQPPVN